MGRMTYPPMPRTHLRKVIIDCIKCESKTVIIASSPIHNGQERQHRCTLCLYHFYSLTPFNNGPVEVQPSPFKREEMTLLDKELRKQAWEEYEHRLVTHQGNYPLLAEIQRALDTREEHRTPRQEKLVHCYDVLQQVMKGIPSDGE